MDISIRRLRDFMVVAEAGSFTRAAAEAYVAQPALSAQIKRLEQDLGAKVFVRHARGVELTEAGELLYERLGTILRDYDTMLSEVGALGNESTGVLTVGSFAQGPGEFLPKIMRAFKEKHPKAEVVLKQYGPTDCFVGVGSGITDVGFAVGDLDEDARVASYPLFEEPVVAVMAADYPLAHMKRLKASDLSEVPFIGDTHPPGRWWDFWNLAEFRSEHSPFAGRHTNHDEWLVDVQLGRGIGICPLNTARYYPRPQLVFIPIDGIAPAVHRVVWRAGTDNPLVRDFVELARIAAGAA